METELTLEIQEETPVELSIEDETPIIVEITETGPPGQGINVNLTVSDTAPPTPSVNDLWVDTSSV